MSNQYHYNKDEWDTFIYDLNSKYKIVTTNKVNNVLSTSDDNLLIKDIAAISTNVNYIIAINTGPIVPLFNIYTMNRIKKFIILDNIYYYSYEKTITLKNMPPI